jgi:hypothetical protein
MNMAYFFHKQDFAKSSKEYIGVSYRSRPLYPQVPFSTIPWFQHQSTALRTILSAIFAVHERLAN